jgi:cell division protein FtsI (penicillin-binding protein 3)
MKPFTIAIALEAASCVPTRSIHTEGGRAHDRAQHDPRRASGRAADGRAGDPEVVERRRREDRAVDAADDAVDDVLRGGLRHAAAHRLPGEVSGRLRPAKTWKPIEQATMSYGHGLSVNLVQLARATRSSPTTASSSRSRCSRRTAPSRAPVIKRETARAVRHMLELATQPGGTAPEGAGAGLSRRRQDRDRAQERRAAYTTKYVASFVGFAPLSNPRLDRRGDDRRALRRRSTTAATSPGRCSRT